MNESALSFRPVGREDVAWLGTGPIPAAPYYDTGYYELEREAVFRRSWINVAHVCELPDAGSFIRREIEVVGASVLIVRGRDGVIRAFHNVCTHRGTRLVEAEGGRQSKFSCPYHRWTYSTDGSLLSAPDFEQFDLQKDECALPSVAIETVGGLVFVNLAERPESLRTSMGELAGQLDALPVAQATTFTEYVYEIDANWKLTYDNFQENYHLRFVHPRSGGAGMGPDNPFGYPVRYGFYGPHRTQTIWSDPAPQPQPPTLVAAFRRAIGAAARKGVSVGSEPKNYYALFPNFFMLGSRLQPFSQVVMPLGAARSRGVIRMYWIGGDADASERFAREYMMASVRDVHSEDRNVIEAGQKGLSSGALKEIHFQTQEVLCRHLFTEVDGRVRAYRAELRASDGRS